ncbi:unnamed protein product, partial [marine sediment metagenome]
LLENKVIVNDDYIEDKSPSEFYKLLEEEAETMRMYPFFKKRYGSPRSVGMRIRNVQDELRRVFNVKINKVSHNVILYDFRPLGEERSKIEKKVEKIKGEKKQEAVKEKNDEKKEFSESVEEGVGRIKAKYRGTSEQKKRKSTKNST